MKSHPKYDEMIAYVLPASIVQLYFRNSLNNELGEARELAKEVRQKRRDELFLKTIEQVVYENEYETHKVEFGEIM